MATCPRCRSPHAIVEEVDLSDPRRRRYLGDTRIVYVECECEAKPFYAERPKGYEPREDEALNARLYAEGVVAMERGGGNRE